MEVAVSVAVGATLAVGSIFAIVAGVAVLAGSSAEVIPQPKEAASKGINTSSAKTIRVERNLFIVDSPFIF
jgi:hypothetical protein